MNAALRKRCAPSPGLMPLVAMQRQGIRLQQSGKKIGRERHPPPRQDDDRRMSARGCFSCFCCGLSRKARASALWLTISFVTGSAKSSTSFSRTNLFLAGNLLQQMQRVLKGRLGAILP